MLAIVSILGRGHERGAGAGAGGHLSALQSDGRGEKGEGRASALLLLLLSSQNPCEELEKEEERRESIEAQKGGWIITLGPLLFFFFCFSVSPS